MYRSSLISVKTYSLWRVRGLWVPRAFKQLPAALLVESISTEARQQMVFRQLKGLFSMPVWFEIGITQSMAWTLHALYITQVLLRILTLSSRTSQP